MRIYTTTRMEIDHKEVPATQPIKFPTPVVAVPVSCEGSGPVPSTPLRFCSCGREITRDMPADSVLCKECRDGQRARVSHDDAPKPPIPVVITGKPNNSP